MNRVACSKSQIAFVVIVAALLSAIVAVYRASQTPLLSVEIEMSSPQPGIAELFYDLGRGFVAQDSVRVPVIGGNKPTVYRFALPPAKHGDDLRFDPIERGDCIVIIHQARIVARDGAVKPLSLSSFQVGANIRDMQLIDGELRLILGPQDVDPMMSLDTRGPFAPKTLWQRFFPPPAREFSLLFLLLCATAFGWLLFVPRDYRGIFLLIPPLVVVALLFARSRFLDPVSWDEELFLWQGWMVKTGRVPYRDFFEPKPPFIFFVNALGLTLFGLKDNLFRLLPTVVALGSTFFFYVAAIKRRIASWLAALLAAQAALWLLAGDFHDTGLNDTETYGFSFTLIGFSLGSLSRGIAARPGRIAVQLLSGICFGLAILSKELFVASAVPAWILAARPGEDEKWDWRQLCFSAAGVILVGGATLVYLASQSALGAYLNLLRYYRPMAANYAVDIGRFPNVTGMVALRQCWTMLHAKLYNLRQLAFVTPLWVAGLVLLRRPRLTTGLIELTTAVAALILGMVAVSVGYCFWIHYFLMGTMGLLLLSVIGAEALSRFLSQKTKGVSQVAFIGLLSLFLFVAAIPTWAVITEKKTAAHISVDPVILQTIEARSKPGDYILTAESPIVCVLANRQNALSVCGLNDAILPYIKGTPLQIETLRGNLEEKLPKVFVFGTNVQIQQKAFHRVLFDPFLAEHHYVRVNDLLWYLPGEN